MIVYKITNIVTGKCYIGITIQSLKARWEGHLAKMRSGDSRHLYCSMRKYGIDKFKIEQIDTANTIQELLEKEKYYVNMYNSRMCGYNMTEGGDTNPMSDIEVAKKHKSRMRSLATREKISQTMKRKAKEGSLFSKEHRKHLSESALGNHNFGTGDTRSVGCYCILQDGSKKVFHNLTQAARWWYDTLKPTEKYSAATYIRKIRKSINNQEVFFGHKGNKDFKLITNISWYEDN